jgi:hypothetical protein
VHYRAGDYAQAAHWFDARCRNAGCAERRGASGHLAAPVGASTLAAGGDTKSSRVLYEQLLKSDADLAAC